MRRQLLISLLAISIVACQREAPQEATGASGGDAPAAVTPSQTPLEDVIERTPRYLVGITFPPVANQYPPLANVLRSYAAEARADLAEAVKLAEGAAQGAPPYDLSLNFTDISKSEDAVVIAADGSLYTGGAHGIPLIARFTYLPQEQRILQASDLVPSTEGWQAISEYVRGQLSEAMEARLAEDEVPATERAEIIKNAAAMIEEGTLPDPANFAQFEPIPSADGKWYGLRFVFPPYQVGPYSDGTQAVEVPAAVLKPHLSDRYRGRFTGN